MSDQRLVEDVEAVITWTLERNGDNYDKEDEVRKLSADHCVDPGSCDQMICMICTMVCEEPNKCASCQRPFCKDCIEKW